MKIGIITFVNSSNYGAVLQAYALQTYLQRCGHKVYFINYVFVWEQLYKNVVHRWLGRSLKSTFFKINANLIKMKFDNFRNKWLNMDPTLYLNAQEIQKNSPEADAYIVGSDQVWNPSYIQAKDDVAVWLDFGHNSEKKIAYAASFGTDHLDNSVINRWSLFVKGFSYISVREASGLSLMQHLEFHDAMWVPDPTMLLEPQDYAAVMGAPQKNKPYLFSYVLGNDSAELVQSVCDIMISDNKLVVEKCRPESLFNTMLSMGASSPSEWLSGIKYSDFVVTNSFHGLVFSILFHKPFIVVARSQESAKMNSRIESLLGLFGLERRICHNVTDITACLGSVINWGHVDFQLKQYRESGKAFLAKALD